MTDTPIGNGRAAAFPLPSTSLPTRAVPPPPPSARPAPPPPPSARLARWWLHLPDHSDVAINEGLDVGRAESLTLPVREAMAPFTDVSGIHLRLVVRDGALFAQHLSKNSVTFIVSRKSQAISEQHLPPEEVELVSGTVLRLGDHAYIQVKKED